MNLLIYQKEDVTSIFCLLPLTKDEDLMRFNEALSNKQVELTFVDVEVVKLEIIDAIIKNMDHTKIKIVSSYLSRYFTELKIPHEFIRLKDVKSVTLNASDIDDKHVKEVIKVADSYGYDLSGYKYESIKKSLAIAIRRKRYLNIDTFIHDIKNSETFFNKILNYIFINVSSFFRDPQVFTYIKENIISKLSVYPRIRVWCAGSSTGMEPYTIAMLLSEAGLLDRTDIYATDVNTNNLQIADNGMYSETIINKGNINYCVYGGDQAFTDYFDYNGYYYKVKDSLKKHIHFFQHDLVSGGSINEFEMVLCRNVLIYFGTSLKNKVLKLLSESIHPNGFLVLGKNERIYNLESEELFTAVYKPVSIYRRGY